MATKGTLIKIENPAQGVSREEYEAVCAAIGVEPKPPATAASDEKQPAV